ncbi:GFA family protein [Aestuariivirga litoralis]|uniref:GFA family protein n=1 Tax=Aestuariivirga litoralis TaxID=2650924 RepID=UPI0018C59E6D|nr:GFA family protein [Aestuariivirga litoralis]MBG1232051.1 GFA family protein [Aestuariivirga litoralis]
MTGKPETQTWSGGCQCGAVRYRMLARPSGAHLCHCRMCQKHFGNFFSALVEIPKDKFRLTHGKISTFESSDEVYRGFCKSCGTPLSLDAAKESKFYIAIGTMDNYSEFAPQAQFGMESRHDFVQHLHELPAYVSGHDEKGATEFSKLLPGIKASNHQHPDQDTKDWPLPPEKE